MIRNYSELTRLEMEQIDREETIVLIPLGALERSPRTVYPGHRK